MSQSQLHDAVRFSLGQLDDPAAWTSIVIDRRKPHTYRAFTMWGETRICLHRFEPCEPDDSFPHPHPWPSSMLILDGTYEMRVGHTPDLESGEPAEVIRLSLGRGSIYEMNERQTWHQVIPRTRCFSLMINGPYWEDAHRRAPRTAGKGLQAMSDSDLLSHLEQFRILLTDYQSTLEG
jgi:hypothetical protein